MSQNGFAHKISITEESSATSTSNTTQQSKNAIDLILQDHAQIRQMFSMLDTKLDNSIDESRTMFNDLKNFLIKHETMEQTAWYPELEKQSDLKSIIAELKKEEQNAGKEIQKIDAIKDNKEWVAAVKKLQTAVNEHAKDEETKLFPKVKQQLSQQKLLELGDKLSKYKADNNMKD